MLGKLIKLSNLGCDQYCNNLYDTSKIVCGLQYNVHYVMYLSKFKFEYFDSSIKDIADNFVFAKLSQYHYSPKTLLSLCKNSTGYTFTCIDENEKETNSMEENNNNMIEELLENGIGIRGLKNKAINKLIKAGYNKTLNHFGVSVYSDNYNDSYDMLKIIKELDKKDKIKIKEDNKYIINSTYLLKLRKDTFILVSGSSKSNSTSLYLYFFGKKSQRYYKWFVSKLTANDNNSKYVYNISYSKEDQRGWKCIMNTVAKRDFSTLFFDNHIEEDIKKFLDNWIENESIYRSRGLLFKTGILLYGNPGTGKSSIANAIAAYLNCNIVTIDMTNFASLDIAGISTTINADSSRYVILLDEIDVLFSNRDDSSNKDQNEAISKLLLLLDSVQSPDNVVFVATTNYVDRLDPALIRKGRFDKKIEIGNISYNTAVKMCRSFGIKDEREVELLLSKNNKDKDNKFNPATLQSDILEVMKSHLQNE